MCPRAHGKQFGCRPSEASRRNDGFRTATGRRVANQGARTITGVSADGHGTAMTYAVADVMVALDSVSQICDRDATVVFHKRGGHIIDASGEKHRFERHGDTYIREVWVDQEPSFPGLKTRSS